MKKSLIILILLILTFALINCVVAVVDYSTPSKEISLGEFNRLLPFKPGGSLSVRNIQGEVAVYGWDRNEVELRAVRRLRESSRTVRFMSWKAVSPDIQVDRFGDSISISTKRRGRDDYFPFVDYELKVPQAIIIDGIFVQNGDIFVYDCFGEILLETGRGNIEVDNFSGSMKATVGIGAISTWLFDLRPEDEINLFVEEGNINIYLQEGVQAQIKAFAEKGEIISDFDLGEELPLQTFSGKIGEEEGASITLNSRNGNIYIGKIKE
ncbi:MAG: hypothetical protein ACOC57_06875 [Acidobacteriota bacterium]